MNVDWEDHLLSTVVGAIVLAVVVLVVLTLIIVMNNWPEISFFIISIFVTLLLMWGIGAVTREVCGFIAED